MVSGGGSKSQGSGATGPVTSLSFVPALLANAFFGSGIGLDDGGFRITGLGDFNSSGKIRGGRNSSLIDPFGLSEIIGSNPLLTKKNPFSQNNPYSPINNPDSPYYNPFSNFTGDSFGGFTGQGGNLSNLIGTQGTPGDFLTSSAGQTLTNFFGGGSNPAFTGIAKKLGIFDEGISPEDAARASTDSLRRFSPGALGLGRGGALNPFDLLSNITDLANPGINPGVGGALQGLMASDLGSLFGNSLLLGDIGPTLQEGLRTGFKPDLQPIINEASRAFFSDIVPQLGQSNVALQEGVGPFSTDLSAALTNAGGALASQLGSLEVENQNRAADRRGEFLGLSGLITDQLFNASTDAARNRLDLGEQLAMLGTRGGRQSQLLQLLAGMTPAGPIQSSASQNSSKSAQGGIL